MLVLRVDKTAEGKFMFLEAMNIAVMEKWQKEESGNLLSTPDKWEKLIKEGYKKMFLFWMGIGFKRDAARKLGQKPYRTNRRNYQNP